MKKRKVLVTGAGAPGGPGVIKALQQASFDLYASDSYSLASGRFLNDAFVQIPKADDADFIPFVLNFCIENKIDAIFPLVTKELFKFSQEKENFLANNIKVIVSEYESLAIANDKGKVYRHLSARSITVPAFEIVTTVAELVSAAKNLGYPETAVCVKPTVSNGSRGVRILQENVDEFDLLFNHKPNSMYSNLEKICSILNEKEFPELVVSEYLPGPEFTIDSIVLNGEPRLILPRSRTKMNSGISVQGTFIKDDSIINYCDEILRSMNLSGPIGLQVKEAVDGTFKLLEINPRIQGTSVAALGIGINLPAIAINQEFEPVSINITDIRWGTSFVRYYGEIYY